MVDFIRLKFSYLLIALLEAVIPKEYTHIEWDLEESNLYLYKEEKKWKTNS